MDVDSGTALIKVVPFSGPLGAEIEGVDMTKVNDAVFSEIQ